MTVPIGSPVRSLMPWCSTSHGATPRSASMIGDDADAAQHEPGEAAQQALGDAVPRHVVRRYRRGRRGVPVAPRTRQRGRDGDGERPAQLGDARSGRHRRTSRRRRRGAAVRRGDTIVTDSTRSSRYTGECTQPPGEHLDDEPGAGPPAVAEHEADVEHAVVELLAPRRREALGRVARRCRSSRARRGAAAVELEVERLHPRQLAGRARPPARATCRASAAAARGRRRPGV